MENDQSMSIRTIVGIVLRLSPIRYLMNVVGSIKIRVEQCVHRLLSLEQILMKLSDQMNDLNAKIDQIVILNEELQHDVFEVQKRLLDLQEDYSMRSSSSSMDGQTSLDLHSDSASIYSDVTNAEAQVAMSPVRLSEAEKNTMQSSASRPSTMKMLIDRLTA